MQRRREVQEKYHFQQPPALRIDSKMESTSAKILQLIRPSRYIETVKFKRKAWARKRVVSNPFLYGESSLSEDDKNESVSSPDGSFAEGTVFESNEDISSGNGGQEMYENVNNVQDKGQRHRSQSAFLPDNSYQEQPVFKSTPKISTFPKGGDFYENVKVETVGEKWQNVFETSQVETQSEDVFDGSKEDGNRNVSVEIHSSSENGGQDYYENVIIKKDIRSTGGEKLSEATEKEEQRDDMSEQRSERKVIQVQSNGHEQECYENVREHFKNVEEKWQNIFEIPQKDKHNDDVSDCEENRRLNEADFQSSTNPSFPNHSLTGVSHASSPTMVNQIGMTDVNIPGRLDICRETEDLYVNTRKFKVRQSSEGCYSRGESSSSQEDEVSRSVRKMSLEHSEMKERKDEMSYPYKPAFDVQHELPSPDYLDDPDSVYANFLQMQESKNMLKDDKELRQQNEDVYEVMTRSRVNHHEMFYDSEEQYVNYSSRSQYVQRKSDVEITSSVHEESSQKLTKHLLSFPRS